MVSVLEASVNVRSKSVSAGMEINGVEFLKAKLSKSNTSLYQTSTVARLTSPELCII